jgi:Lon protease-like protein
MQGEMEIPLFPLPNLVVFPHIVVPLHIFEERYKLMINGCVDRDEVFGLILLRAGADDETEDTIHRVGVSARIVEVERLDEGRMNILCEGESRFRVLRFTQQTPFWKGAVDLFEDTEQQAPESLYEQVADLYRTVANISAQVGGTQQSELILPESGTDLSYMLSYVLDIDWEEKQKLLEMDSTPERLRLLIAHLTDTIRKLEQQRAHKEVMTKVRGNGDLGMPHGRES